jgi:hypothetical protein
MLTLSRKYPSQKGTKSGQQPQLLIYFSRGFYSRKDREESKAKSRAKQTSYIASRILL